MDFLTENIQLFELRGSAALSANMHAYGDGDSTNSVAGVGLGDSWIVQEDAGGGVASPLLTFH